MLQFQPSKQKNKKQADFDTSFEFVSSVEEYNKDAWNDLTKYVKRKAKTKTDDKIKKIRKENSLNEDETETKIIETNNTNGLDVDLSDDELKYDNIRTKEKKGKKRKFEETNAETTTDDGFFEDVQLPEDNVSFYQMNLSRPLLKAIGEMKFVHPTPIQAATIPLALLGRDICGCAATGTGKTAAYMLPTLERLIYRPSGNTPVTRVLVLVPTRELGVQVYQVSRQLCQFTDIEIGLAVGGLDLKAQENVLRKNPDIVIATPGRLIDHLRSTPSFSLDSIEVLILDEADRMLDEYFAEQMKEIIKQCARTRQTMLFSATMSDEVKDLASVSLVKPARIFVDSNRDVAFNLRQEFVRIRSEKETDREPILAALVCRTFREHAIIFVQTKKQAHRLHILLGLLGVSVAELHGNLTQPQRLDALQKFKSKEVDVLVATDVAARGLDIHGVQTVINFVMPATLEHYIHRVGRTARAGRAGVSVSLAGEQERKMVKDIIKRAKNPVKSRVIPPDIIEKYRSKLEKLEPQIEQILQEEYEERLLSKAENQANRLQNKLEGEKGENRSWFQTKKQRKEEKQRLALKPKAGADKNDKKSKQNQKSKNRKGKKASDTPEDRINHEMEKVALLQARLAKRKSKMKKLRTCVDPSANGKLEAKKKKSIFDDSFSSKRGKGNKVRNVKNQKGGAKAKGGKGKGGKAFGRPQTKKKRF